MLGAFAALTSCLCLRIPSVSMRLLAVGTSPFIAATISSFVLAFAATRPGWKRLSILAVAGTAFYALYVHAGGAVGVFVAGPVMAWGAVTGLLAFPWLAVLAFRPQFPGRLVALRQLAFLVGLAGFLVISGKFLHLLPRLYPNVYDPQLYLLDNSIIPHVSFQVGVWLRDSTPIRNCSFIAYFWLPLFVVLLQVLEKPTEHRILSVNAWRFLFIGIGGALLYNLYPACGPIYLFPSQFPSTAPDPKSLALATVAIPFAARNAIPSLHMAWALGLLIGAWTLGWWQRVVFLCVAVFTVLATMGQGEHYLVDLIVAVPFAYAVHYSVRWYFEAGDEARMAALWSAAGLWVLTLAWFAALRYGLRPLVEVHGLSVAFSIATLALTAFAVFANAPRPSRRR